MNPTKMSKSTTCGYQAAESIHCPSIRGITELEKKGGTTTQSGHTIGHARHRGKVLAGLMGKVRRGGRERRERGRAMHIKSHHPGSSTEKSLRTAQSLKRKRQYEDSAVAYNSKGLLIGRVEKVREAVEQNNQRDQLHKAGFITSSN